MVARHITNAQEHLAAKLLVDTCTIHRPDATGALNPTTLALVDGGAQLWEGKCFVNFRPGDSAGEYVTIEALGRSDQRVRVRLPLACPALDRGDLITVTESDNAQLLSVELEVLDDSTGSYAVSKIVRCRMRKRADS